mmetsp:Transcript_7411/g.12522  ORF Transcript_7411/g.12522 Transcript_7411/m.12522 type:complete len:276 (-) Transcript_7411:45-872(-)
MVQFSKLLSLSVLASLLSSQQEGVQARRYLDSHDPFLDPVRRTVQTDDENVIKAVGTQRSPLVQATASDQMCLFQDDFNEWCWYLYSPVLQVGYEFTQAYADGTWQMALKPYFTPEFKYTSVLNLQRILKQELTIELPSFTADVFYSFLFSTTGQVCVGIGWDLGEITYKIESGFQLKNCYKTLIYDLCDFNSNWFGKSAQWLEECEDSTIATITNRNTQIAPAASGYNLIGGTEISGHGCFQFAEWSQWAPMLIQLGMQQAGFTEDTYKQDFTF